jgi:protein-disulfide isomerase
VVPFDAMLAGRGAARAAACAAEQDRFWDMHDLLFEQQAEWRGRVMQRRRFKAMAALLGLDMTAFDECWSANRSRDELKRHTLLARGYGVPGTPTFFVNGRPLVGALAYREFAEHLEAAESSGARRKPGS